MLLLWGPLLCWGLLPQVQGKAQHPFCLRISMNQLKTNISDLLAEQIVERMTNLPVMGEGAAVLEHLPFVKEGLSKKTSGLDLSFVGDLLSGKSLPMLDKLLQAGGLIIEDAKGPEVTLKILSESLLQVTLRLKLYLSLQGILRFKILKNIRVGIRLEKTEYRTEVVLEECHTPPGYLSITVLEKKNTFAAYLMNYILGMVTDFLDRVLPFLLQKIVCPMASTLLTALLEDLLHITQSPAVSHQEDFQYSVTTTRFTDEAIVMDGQGCGEVPRRLYVYMLSTVPDTWSLPTLAQGSMADLAFWPETYNVILSCLHKSKEIHVAPQDSTAADLIQLLSLRELEPRPKASSQSRTHMDLTISTPDAPTIHLENNMATIIQEGSLVLSESNYTTVSVPWKLLSKAKFVSRNQKLILQFTPFSTKITLVPYPGPTRQAIPPAFIPTGLCACTLSSNNGKETRLEALVSELLQGKFCPHYNEVLREKDLPLPKVKGISFNKAQTELSKEFLLLMVPEE